MANLPLSLLSVSLLALVACNSDSADDTVVEASRDLRISSFASTVCDRYEDTGAGCPGYGNGALGDCNADQVCTDPAK
jgi:hypothetical protein